VAFLISLPRPNPPKLVRFKFNLTMLWYNLRMLESFIKHCFLCGNKAHIRYVEGRNRHVCSICETILYQNPSPAAAVLLVNNDQILLVKRGLEPQKGLWALPAGFQEWDETPEQAARREMQEETGLIAENLQLFDLVYNDCVPHKPVNVAVFLAKSARGTLTPGDDVSEADFFPLNQLPSNLAFSYIQRCLQRLPV
jgi:8-oxo-dGTP diphosphatase